MKDRVFYYKIDSSFSPDVEFKYYTQKFHLQNCKIPVIAKGKIYVFHKLVRSKWLLNPTAGQERKTITNKDDLLANYRGENAQSSLTN